MAAKARQRHRSDPPKPASTTFILHASDKEGEQGSEGRRIVCTMFACETQTHAAYRVVREPAR